VEQINLHLFLNHLRNAVVIVRPDGTLFFKNSSFEALFSREMSLHPSATIFDILKKNSEVWESVRKVLDIRGSYYLRDVPITFENKPVCSMDVETFPLIDAEGELLGVTVLFRDRAGLVRFEEQEKRAERLHYLNLISSGLAHEIKNPLSGIKGASQILCQELKGKTELKELAEIVKKEVTRVDALLTDLLHFTKPRTLEKKWINVNQILNDVFLLQKTVSLDRIQYVQEFDPSLPKVQADGAALSQVFLNLIKNARQAILKKGKIMVRSRMVTDFGLRTKDKKRQVIAIDVEDTGQGIDGEALASIFVPFFTTKAEGTGLGLALCQQIVDEHEGNLQVKSEKGKGTLFSVYLPI